MCARRRAGRGDSGAGRSIEWLEPGDLAEMGTVIVVQRVLQVERRAPVQCRAAGKDLYRTAVSELADYDSPGATECAGEPARRQRNAAPIIVAERNERRSVHWLVSRQHAAAIGFGNGLQQREGEYLNPRRDARTGRSDDALPAGRKIDEARGDAHAGPIVTVRFERREERWSGSRR